MSRWTLVCALAPGEHRLFRDEQGRYALADDSGRDPNCTEDGPCYVDPFQVLTLRAGEGSVDGRLYVEPPSYEDPQRNRALYFHRTCHRPEAALVLAQRVGLRYQLVFPDGLTTVIYTPPKHRRASEGASQLGAWLRARDGRGSTAARRQVTQFFLNALYAMTEDDQIERVGLEGLRLRLLLEARTLEMEVIEVREYLDHWGEDHDG